MKNQFFVPLIPCKLKMHLRLSDDIWELFCKRMEHSNKLFVPTIQNTTAEFKNHCLLEVARVLMCLPNVPEHIWFEAILTTSFLIKQMPSSHHYHHLILGLYVCMYKPQCKSIMYITKIIVFRLLLVLISWCLESYNPSHLILIYRIGIMGCYNKWYQSNKMGCKIRIKIGIKPHKSSCWECRSGR